MSLSKQIVGMHFRYPDHYVVGREKLREYALAVKNETPPTTTTPPPPNWATTRSARR